MMPSLILDDFGRPKPQIETADGTGFEPWRGENGAGRITGDIAHDEPDAGRPVKIGGKAVNPASLPADVSPGDRVNALFDQKGRLMVRMDLSSPLPTGAATETTLTSANNNLTTIKDTLTAIRDTAGIKKIVDPVTVQMVQAPPLPTGAATETTLSSVNSTLTAIHTTDGIKKIADPINLAYANLTILSSSARTISGTSTEFVVGNYREASFFLNVTEVSGTNPTLDVVIQTKDPVSGEWFDIVTFTQVTDVTKERKADKTIDIGSVIRASYTIGGTGTSFTFSLGAVVK